MFLIIKKSIHQLIGNYTFILAKEHLPGSYCSYGPGQEIIKIS